MTTYAFCLGVNQYRAPIDPLKCAEKDARDLAALLKHKLGFEAEYLEERYTEAIEDRIAALEEKLRPGDSFLFYFSGHGKAHGEDQYFLLPGCRYEQLEAGATVTGGVLSWQSLKQLTARDKWRGVHRIFIIDACRTHLIAGKGAGEHPAFDGRVLLRDPTGAGNARAGETETPLTLINACGEGQCAVEIPERGNSVFNSVLMTTLEQAAERGGDIRIDRDFVAELIAPIAALGRQYGYHGETQTPFFRGAEARLKARPNRLAEPTSTSTAGPNAEQLDERLWSIACSKNTIAGYEQYLKESLLALHQDEALERLREERIFNSRTSSSHSTIPAPQPAPLPTSKPISTQSIHPHFSQPENLSKKKNGVQLSLIIFLPVLLIFALSTIKRPLSIALASNFGESALSETYSAAVIAAAIAIVGAAISIALDFAYERHLNDRDKCGFLSKCQLIFTLSFVLLIAVNISLTTTDGTAPILITLSTIITSLAQLYSAIGLRKTYFAQIKHA